MEQTILKQIQDRHRLEIALLRFRHQSGETGAALAQAQFDLREAQQAQALYSGSFARFRDTLTGKKEAREQELRHAVQQAQTDLLTARQAQTRLSHQISEAAKQLAALPDWDVLKEQASPDELREWHRLDALYGIEALRPLLETNLELLAERRAQFNGTYAGQAKTWQNLAQIYTAPEAAGEACKPHLLRMKTALDALEIPFTISPYFDNPTGFLSFATKYTRMDRINDAIGQTEKLLRQLPELQRKLEG